MESRNDNLSVSPVLYTDEYYLTDCGGYLEFIESHGEQLPLRLAKALELAGVSRGQKVLDVGCGRGEILFHCARRGASVVGVDYSPAAVRIAANLVNGSNTGQTQSGVVRGNGKSLSFPNEVFDIIFLVDIVEHLYPSELAAVLNEVNRVLRPGGRIIIHTAPNRTFVDYGFRFYTRYWHRFINWLFKRNHVVDLRPGLSPLVHVNELTISELKRWLTPFTHRRVWLEVFLGDDRSRLRTIIRGAVTHLYPLSILWPLNRFFAYWIWAVAHKESVSGKTRDI